MWDVGVAVHTFEDEGPLLFGCDKASKADLHIIYNGANHYSGTGTYNMP